MRMVFGLVLMVGLLLAGGAVFLAQKYIGQTQAQLAVEKANKAKYGPLIEVFVVNKPVNYGEPLGPADVQKVLMQQSAMPEGAFTDPAVLFPDGEKTPRFVLRQMEKFEPVLALKVTEPGESAGLTGIASYSAQVIPRCTRWPLTMMVLPSGAIILSASLSSLILRRRLLIRIAASAFVMVARPAMTAPSADL